MLVLSAAAVQCKVTINMDQDHNVLTLSINPLSTWARW
jgi:hypothetical protein